MPGSVSLGNKRLKWQQRWLKSSHNAEPPSVSNESRIEYDRALAECTKAWYSAL